ncbi:MAG: Uma2 family endonuclease [Anaerolinea sp.]|nr:Uma2 family endonuclease [Anaerolinea sp.]
MSAARASTPEQVAVPPLESGDVMTRVEFHRRYSMHPEIKKAELIEGVVFVSSPLKAKGHGDEDLDMTAWLGAYRARTPGVRGSANATVILDNDNEVQPDISLRWVEEGSTHLTPDGYVAGPPELVVEIAGSSVSRDMHQKLAAYQRNGVQEYIVWRVEDAAIDWFVLEDGRYRKLEPDADGIVSSRVFPGLRLDVAAMLAGDLAKVLAVQTG